MNDYPQKSLDERLADLPRDVAPPRNLWPHIARRIEVTARSRHNSRRPRPFMYAAAAALAGACLASALTWNVLRGRAAADSPRITQRTSSFDEPRDPHYVAARISLESTFRERLALLEPGTRAKIEASLEVIRKAHADIQNALADDPASPVLEQLWQSTWRDELDLYDHVVRATEPTMTRT